MSRAPFRRIHITGGPGAGKTTLARLLAERMGVPYFDLDGQSLAFVADMPLLDFDLLKAKREAAARAFISATSGWVSEGACFEPYVILHEAADVIVLMKEPWRVAAYRILMRHVKAELAGSNRFPGWGRLLTFWRWSRRFYSNSNPHVLNEWGTPSTERLMMQYLGPYEEKIWICSSKQDRMELLRLVDRPDVDALA